MSIGRMVKKIVNFPAILAIRTYQKIISPLLPPSCRFYPSCSQYGLECFQKHHIFKAFWLTCWRILRCNPFNDGGHDPVPPNNHELKAVKEALPQSRDSQ